jgi:thiamine-monophosphate kinase
LNREYWFENQPSLVTALGGVNPYFPIPAIQIPYENSDHTLRCVYESIQNGVLTTVQMSSEDQLIERVQRKFPSRKGLRVGIGDDAAVLRPGTSRTELVVTTDAFLENVHFFKAVHPPKAVGYKALARATSDLAAMGAHPKCFFLTLGLPEACTGAWLDGFLEGMARAARRFGLVLAGGDTTRCSLIVAGLTVIGEADQGKAILRSGARPGDLLCVSGRLGEAELGLRLILKKLHQRKGWARLLKRHFYPKPRLALGQWLAARGYASAMIDTSDGLSTDLGHICKASGVGAAVWASKIPAVKVPPGLRSPRFDPLDLALNGGEDYELLFTVPKRFASRLPRRFEGVPVTVIGEITRKKSVVLIEQGDRAVPLRPRGWDPFR